MKCLELEKYPVRKVKLEMVKLKIIDLEMIDLEKIGLKIRTRTRTYRPFLDGGGGFMFYIKEGVIFEVVGNSSHKRTEVSTIKVRLGKRKWALITNIYCPPNRTNNPVSLSLKHVIPGKRSLVQETSMPIAGYVTSANQRIPEERIYLNGQ